MRVDGRSKVRLNALVRRLMLRKSGRSALGYLQFGHASVTFASCVYFMCARTCCVNQIKSPPHAKAVMPSRRYLRGPHC